MIGVPDDAGLREMAAERLYRLLDDLGEYRRQDGRGRSEAAMYVRDYCARERRRVQRELRWRELPATRPGDGRVYGPGVMRWQKPLGGRLAP